MKSSKRGKTPKASGAPEDEFLEDENIGLRCHDHLMDRVAWLNTEKKKRAQTVEKEMQENTCSKIKRIIDKKKEDAVRSH